MSQGSVRITKLFVKRLNPQVEPKMMNLANAIAERMQRIVPKRTWALHNSISPEFVSSDSRKIVTRVLVGGETAPYWDFVELGTSRMEAQPYIMPAVLQSTSRDLNFGGEPSPHDLVDYVRNDGVTIQVTRAQRDNYGRNRPRP